MRAHHAHPVISKWYDEKGHEQKEKGASTRRK